MKNKSESNCLNCHFFMYRIPSNSVSEYPEDAVRQNERKELQSKIFKINSNGIKLKCFHGVWNEEIATLDETEKYSIITKNRKNKCFFYKYQPEMMTQSAVELQKREYEIRKLKISNSFAVIGLFISATALLLNTVIQIYRTLIGK